jgi:hypothetical protein
MSVQPGGKAASTSNTHSIVKKFEIGVQGEYWLEAKSIFETIKQKPVGWEQDARRVKPPEAQKW